MTFISVRRGLSRLARIEMAVATSELFSVEPREVVAAADRSGLRVLDHEIANGFMVACDEQSSHAAEGCKMLVKARNLILEPVAALALCRLAQLRAHRPPAVRRNRRQRKLDGLTVGINHVQPRTDVCCLHEPWPQLALTAERPLDRPVE